MMRYTVDQLTAWIKRNLGSPFINLEIDQQQIIDQIYIALSLFSLYRPRPRYGSLRMFPGQFFYLQGVPVGQGIAEVWFVQPNPVPEELFWGNLIYPTPTFKTGLDEYDMFLRWQKTWLRVASIQPQWTYDETERALYIHNPLDRYMCGLLIYENWEDTTGLDLFGSQWVRDYALQKARLLLGEMLLKFSGAIPGPARDLQLDIAKRDKAQIEIDKLEARLFGSQMMPGLQTD